MDADSLDVSGCLVGPSGERVCPLGKTSFIRKYTPDLEFLTYMQYLHLLESRDLRRGGGGIHGFPVLCTILKNYDLLFNGMDYFNWHVMNLTRVTILLML